MKQIKVENIYTSIGVNRSPHSLDWGNNGLFCYAASNSIAILDPNVRKIIQNLLNLIKLFFFSLKIPLVKF